MKSNRWKKSLEPEKVAPSLDWSFFLVGINNKRKSQELTVVINTTIETLHRHSENKTQPVRSECLDILDMNFNQFSNLQLYFLLTYSSALLAPPPTISCLTFKSMLVSMILDGSAKTKPLWILNLRWEESLITMFAFSSLHVVNRRRLYL